MKVVYRIPTKHEYAYVEYEREYEETISAHTIKEHYDELTAAMRGGEGPGLTAKEVDSILDGWFSGKGVNSDLYDKRNPEQDKWFQAIKRSLARIKRQPVEDNETE